MDHKVNNAAPARLNERSFRRYEPVIFKAVTTFPVAFAVATSQPNAYACGLRNALKSLYQFQWQTTVPHNLFLELYESRKIVVREATGKVVIGDRYTTKERPAEAASASGLIIKPHRSEAASPVVDVSNLAAVASILCDLAAQRTLACPIVLSGLTDEAAAELNQSFDVLLERTSAPGEWLLT